jgi:8-oxo-dGTP pyrophosphatase MutT (NUDIX family)
MNHYSQLHQETCDLLAAYDAHFVSEATDPSLVRFRVQLGKSDPELFGKFGMYHVTHSVIVLDAHRKQVLVIQKKLQGSDFSWTLPCGHIERGTVSLWESVQDHLRHQTGLHEVERLSPGKVMLPLDIHNDFVDENPATREAYHFHHDFLFLAQCTDPSFHPVCKTQVDGLDVRWMPVADFIGTPGKRMKRVGLKLGDFLGHPSPALAN